MTPSRRFGWLFAQVDGASLAVFRIMFGLLMAGYCVRMLTGSYLEGAYVRPRMLFTYLGFDWVQPLPLPGLYGVTVGMLCAALLFAVGIGQRIAAAAFGLGWTYFFLLEKAYYINHFYLVSLLMLLFVLLPANGALTPRWAGYARTTVPAFALWAIRAQFGIVYFYAGLAKIQPDWLAGEPMRRFLRPYFGSELSLDIAAYAFSWGGLVFDLAVVPGLLWRRTRIPTVLFATGFHLANFQIFSIDFFPWLAIAGTLLFFEPDWPRTVWARLGITDRGSPAPVHRGVFSQHRFSIAVLGIYFIVQIVVPFQRVLYPGNAQWTEEGQKFSWLLMMKHKTGNVDFTVVNRKTGERTQINEKHYLNDRQILIMTGDPDMLVQFAAFLAGEQASRGAPDVAVFADTAVSLNGRRKQPIVPPDFDLSAADRHWGHYAWIVPLREAG